MIATIEPNRWISFIEKEYLADFIRRGGSAIKFAVPTQDVSADKLMERLEPIAVHLGYVVVRINAAETELYKVDELYFRAASQVPWRVLSRSMLERLSLEAGFRWVEGSPLFQHLAEANNISPDMVLIELKRRIAERVLKDSTLCKDFRIAMTGLCSAELEVGERSEAITLITDWLTGRNKNVGALKPYNIYAKINRNSARYFIESLTHWVAMSGKSGLLVNIDIARVTVLLNPNDQKVFFPIAKAIDTYEVFREFIDRLEQLRSCLMIVVPDGSFLTNQRRGIYLHRPLHSRINDEIRHPVLVNPMASMVRLANR